MILLLWQCIPACIQDLNNFILDRVSAFEFTSACTVFDLLDIPLYHGWLVDPQLSSTVAAVGSCSYNQLVEKIIEQKGSKQEHLVTEGIPCGSIDALH